MTKQRLPDSFEDAALIAAGQLGPDRMGVIAGGITGSAIRNWNDPDRPGRPTLHQALKVDAAIALMPGGQGQTPFLTAYRRQLHDLTEPVVAVGDVVSEVLDLPGAVGRITDAVAAARAIGSSCGVKISATEDHTIRRAIKAAHDALDEIKAALVAERKT